MGSKKTKGIKNVLVKVSGDVKNKQKFKDFVIKLAKKAFVVIVVGGGTEISEKLTDAGYKIIFDDKHGRVTETWEERKIAREVLEKNAKKMQDDFVGKGIIVTPSIIDIAGVTCHINGDNYIKAAYLGFDELYVFTLKDRKDAKKEIFKNYEKVKIITV